MKRRILCLLLAAAMLLGLSVTALAGEPDAQCAAESLYQLGLFNGTGTYADGSPKFELDRAPTRFEAVTMLVRLLGKEDEAKNGAWTTPFTDLEPWAAPYVGYAYANQLTNGTGSDRFGGKETVTAAQYLTFVLRALGYRSGEDFVWSRAWELTDRLGLTAGRYHAQTTRFLRGDVALISCNALNIACRDSDQKLYQTLGLSEEKQALAAVGQAELMQIYERFFSDYGRSVAQILITRSTVDNETSKRNVQNTVSKLLSLGCVPIVNENDTVSFEEIEFGDNDTLAAYVAVLADADMLINLSDIDGLYDSDPHCNPDAGLISHVPEITDDIRSCAGGSGSDFGTGGVVTKLHAAEIALKHGIPMVLTGGTHPEYIYDIIKGKPVGTLFGTLE